jgi:hypothetical protein
MLRFASGLCVGIALADSEVSTGTNDSATRVHALTGRGSEQVDLEFHGQHSRPFLQERERRISARAVKDGDTDTGVEKPVLLGQPRRERHFDLDQTWLDTSKLSAKGVGQQSLLSETVPHPLCVGRIDWLKSGAHGQRVSEAKGLIRTVRS